MRRFAYLLSTTQVLGLLTGCGNETSGIDAVPDDSVEHADIVKQDLFAVITLTGTPCGEVVEYVVQGELDYLATCETGDRYRVHVTAEGNVNVVDHSPEVDQTR